MNPLDRAHAGFTLIELLVALVLMMVLMFAVNAIFTQTADTISSGQALSTGMRDLRSVQSILKRDLDGAALVDGPFFLIRSTAQVAFLHERDRLEDTDYAATGSAADIATILSAGAESALPVTRYGTRTFRQDTLAFFSRGVFQRQTGNDGVFAAPMSSHEAFIWYGHLRLPGGAAGSFAAPGLSDGGTFSTPNTNPSNFDACQWHLGRMAVLLRRPQSRDVADGTGSPSDRVIYCDPPWPASASDPRWQSQVRQEYFGRGNAGTLEPLAENSRATRNGTLRTAWTIQSSRYDLAATTISDYRMAVAAFGAAWPAAFRYRFCANPFPARPLDGTAAAQAAPIFVPNCSQFLVEYAGDFTAQDEATGQLMATTGGAPDGIVDFVIDPATQTRRTRWYGLPRDVLGTGAIRGVSAAGQYGADLLNVVPLRDVLQSRGFPPSLFERQVPPQRQDYADPAPANGLQTGQAYECAWGPETADAPMPRMLRILIKPEDPHGQIDVPWQEMIFTLP